MPDYIQNIGTAGQMMIRDEGFDFVEFWVKADTAETITGLWTLTYFTKNNGFFNFTLPPGGAWLKLGEVNLNQSVSMSFDVFGTSSSELGQGNLTVMLYRGALFTGARIRQGDRQARAYAYVNDNGIWKQAEVWGKADGEWRRTT